MVNFCPHCGGKFNPDDKFCKSCGANVTGAVETPKPAPAQIPPKRSEPPVIIQLIKAGIQILLLGLFLYWVWYSYGCATGKYPNTGDQICKSFYKTFHNGGININFDDINGGDNQKSIGCQHCQPGNCWVEGKCCPSTAQYYCNGGCYSTSNEAYNSGCHQSSWTRYCCQ